MVVQVREMLEKQIVPGTITFIGVSEKDTNKNHSDAIGLPIPKTTSVEVWGRGRPTDNIFGSTYQGSPCPRAFRMAIYL